MIRKKNSFTPPESFYSAGHKVFFSTVRTEIVAYKKKNNELCLLVSNAFVYIECCNLLFDAAQSNVCDIARGMHAQNFNRIYLNWECIILDIGKIGNNQCTVWSQHNLTKYARFKMRTMITVLRSLKLLHDSISTQPAISFQNRFPMQLQLFRDFNTAVTVWLFLCYPSIWAHSCSIPL